MLERLRGGVVISCQPLPDTADDPLRDPYVQARIAAAAVHGGAAAVRVDGPELAAVRAAARVPVIGLWKDPAPGVTLATGVVITPTVERALQVVRLGADLVAVDATDRPRAEPFAAIAAAVHEQTTALVLADVSTVAEGLAAADGGADAVATTLSGIVPGTGLGPGPDLPLVAELARRLPVPVIAEGRYRTPADVGRALDLGAHAVVVGNAATSPLWIVRQLVAAARRSDRPGLAPAGTGR